MKKSEMTQKQVEVSEAQLVLIQKQFMLSQIQCEENLIRLRNMLAVQLAEEAKASG